MAEDENELPPIGTAQNAADAGRKAESHAQRLAEAIPSDEYPIAVTLLPEAPHNERTLFVSWQHEDEETIQAVVTAVRHKVYDHSAELAAMSAAFGTGEVPETPPKREPKRISLAPTVNGIAFWGPGLVQANG